jgi:hypothetical protein
MWVDLRFLLDSGSGHPLQKPPFARRRVPAIGCFTDSAMKATPSHDQPLHL